MLRSLSAVIAPPKYTNSIVRLYTSPAAMIGKDTCPPLLFSRHIIISVFASDTVSPNDEHAVTINVIILSSHSDDGDTMPASSAYSIPHHLCTSYPSFPLRPLILLVREVPFFSLSFFRWSCTMLSVMAAPGRIYPSSLHHPAARMLAYRRGIGG